MKKFLKIALAVILILVGLQVIGMVVMYFAHRIKPHTVLSIRI